MQKGMILGALLVAAAFAAAPEAQAYGYDYGYGYPYDYGYAGVPQYYSAPVAAPYYGYGNNGYGYGYNGYGYMGYGYGYAPDYSTAYASSPMVSTPVAVQVIPPTPWMFNW